MIVLAGIPSETPLSLVRTKLEAMGAKIIIFNQREFEMMNIDLVIENGNIRGRLEIRDNSYDLQDIKSVYIRLMDENFLPEIENEPSNSEKRIKCRKIHEAFSLFCEITPIPIINKTYSMSSNSSKPYQMQIIRKFGFSVPETLITNNPTKVIQFKEKHEKIIYKSISSLRSIVQEFKDEDVQRLNLISWCPVQFQELIEGLNVRVHVIGNKVFATSMKTDFVDYRYSHRFDKEIKLEEYHLNEDISERCIKLTEGLGLIFSGIDLKITPDNQIFCFEVNPSPGYSYYESNTEQPISTAVAEYLYANHNS